MATFEKVARIQDAVEVSTSLFPDGSGASLIFTNLETRVGGVKDGPRVATRLCTLTLPLRDHTSDCVVKQQLRGNAIRTAHTRAILFARLAGQTLVKELDEGTGGSDFFFDVDSTIPAGSSYVATLLLVAESESDAPGEYALVTLDSMELLLQAGAATRTPA